MRIRNIDSHTYTVHQAYSSPHKPYGDREKIYTRPVLVQNIIWGWISYREKMNGELDPDSHRQDENDRRYGAQLQSKYAQHAKQLGRDAANDKDDQSGGPCRHEEQRDH